MAARDVPGTGTNRGFGQLIALGSAPWTAPLWSPTCGELYSRFEELGQLVFLQNNTLVKGRDYTFEMLTISLKRKDKNH